MIDHQELIRLTIAYTLAGAFVFTVVITCLSLVGWIKFADKKQQQKLFTCLVVQLVVVGVGFFTGFLRFNVPKVAKDLVEQGKAIRKLQEDLAETGKSAEASAVVVGAMRDYGEVAALNLIGKPYPDGDLVYTTGISKALEGSYKIVGTKVEFFRDEASERIYRDVIAKYPRFPFAYAALAYVLSANCDPSWRNYAQQAVSILEKTTKVGGHHPNHDQKLAEFKKVLTE